MALPIAPTSNYSVSRETAFNAAGYFRLKEQFFYYKLINNPRRQRNYSITFIAEVADFLDRHDIEDVFRLFVQTLQGTNHGSASYKNLCKVHPIISAHFSSDDLTDISKAKSAYRNAAMKIHPDVGGSHREMTALNAAFDELLDHLLLASVGGNESKKDGVHVLHRTGSFARGVPQSGFWPGSILQYPQSAQEFELLLRTELLIAAKDIFQEDLFAKQAAHLSLNEIWRPGRDSGDADSRAHACVRVAELIISCREASLENGGDDLSERLMPLAEDWISCASAAWAEAGHQGPQEFGKKRISEADHNDPERLPVIDEWQQKILIGLRHRITSPKSRAESRFQLVHPLQADNARRRGLITEKRFQDALNRFKDQKGATDEAAKKVTGIFQGSGFMPLEHDPVLPDQPVAGLVNERHAEGGFGKWQLADNHSRAGYLRAFYENAELDLKMVYVRQRLWIILSSLIGSGPSDWSPDRIERAAWEVSVLGEAAKASREGLAFDHAEQLTEFLQSLLDESDQDRNKRLELLGKVALEDVRTLMLRDIFPLGPNAKIAVWRGEREWAPLTRVIPSVSYFEAATRPLKYLETYVAKVCSRPSSVPKGVA